MKATDPKQAACFLETARALGCDEDEVAFDEKKVVAGQKTRSEQQKSEPPED